MNAARLLTNLSRGSLVLRRALGTAAKPVETKYPSGYKPKTAYEVWCGDAGAYPVMGVMVFAALFCVTATAYITFSTPDARLSKTSRKAPMRGEFKEEK